MTTQKKRDLSQCQMPHIPTNREGFAPDEVERLMEIRRRRLEKFRTAKADRY